MARRNDQPIRVSLRGSAMSISKGIAIVCLLAAITGCANTPTQTQVLGADAIDQCMAYGFAMGADEIRKNHVDLANVLISSGLVTGSCYGGVAVGSDTHNAYMDGCFQGYRAMQDEIRNEDYILLISTQ